MVAGWTLGLLFNATIAAAYLAVAFLLGSTAIRTNQWRSNPLGLATVILYVGCGGGHAVYSLQLAGIAFGSAAASSAGALTLYAERHMWVWDGVTAAVGIWYWTQRKRFPGLVTGAAVFEDLRVRQRRALELNDDVVQGLARAKLELELGRREEGERTLAETRTAGEAILRRLEARTAKEVG